MKRLHYALRLVALMLGIFVAASASARLQRMPDPGPATPTAEQLEHQKATESFMQFVRSFNASNPSTSIGVDDAPAQLPLRQRPEKIMRSAWDPTGNIYAVIPNFEGISSMNDPFYGKLNVLEGTMDKIWRSSTLSNSEEAYMQSGFVRDNIIYIPQLYYGEMGMAMMEASIIWKRFDISTGKTLPSLNFGTDDKAFRMFTYGLTYDETHDVVYGLAYNNNSGKGGNIIMVDCSKPVEEWEAVELLDAGGTVENWMAGICYNPLDETLYGLNNLGQFCEIDTKNKAVITLREYDDFDDFCFPAEMSATPMCYSPHDKAIIYIFADNNRGVFEACAIDMESYDANFLATLYPRMQVGMLYCSDPFAQDEAPAQMETPILDFQANNLTGTYSFTAPTTYFNGIALDKKMTLHVLVDNVEVYSQEVAPGETVTKQIELSEGLHIFKGYCSLGDLNGPVVSQRIYIGNDQPFPPTALKLENNVLSWTAPVNRGVNNAYIDLSGVTYDIYINGEIFNTAPVSATEYPIDIQTPAEGRKHITVTATANGVTSEPSVELSRVLGKGYELPLTITPTEAESTLFETYNANHDAYEWKFTNYAGQQPNFQVYTTDYTVAPDDWLFLPPMYFDSSTDVYNILVAYVNARHNNTMKDNLDIFIGKDPLPQAMTKLIYTHTARFQGEESDLDVSFSVDEPGTYFIGFHSKPGDDTRYRGICLRNFRIRKTEASTEVPGELSSVSITPAGEGELFVTIEATVPTLSMGGEQLDPEKDVTLTIATNDGSTTVSGKPGETKTTTLSVQTDGFADIFITPLNEHGAGAKQVFTVYVGYDNPVPPTNLRTQISADNLTLNVEWDPVGNVGEHGGYVDPEEVVYDWYTQGSTEATRLDIVGKECRYGFTVAPGTQQRYYVGPVARNFIGNSTNGQFVNETLGTLYTTPIKEEWGLTAFTLNKWLSNLNPPFSNVRWEHCTDPDETTPNITFIQGGAIRAVGTGTGELRAPRVTTATDPMVGVTLRYWNYPYAGHLELWGRTFENQEYVKIAELDPSRPAAGQWEDWEVRLPEEFCNQEWIQVNIRATLTANQAAIIDSYEVAQMIEQDFQLTSASAPYSTFVGEEPEFDIVVTNNGVEMGSGKLTLELLGNDILLDSQEVDIERLRSKQNFEYKAIFPMLESYINYDFIELRCIAVADGDLNPRNNEKSIDVLLYDHSLPIVRDLKAERADNDTDINLSWSAPSTTAKDLESAEIYAPFENKESFGPWTNVDIDGKTPFVVQNKRWPNDDKPSAWTVFDAKEMNTMNEPRLSPRSGSQMFMARSLAYDSSSEAPTRAMDFLISPEVKGGSKVSFWFNTLDSQYAETIAIFYSSTDMTLNPEDVDLESRDTAPRQCGSFKWLKNFTKSGAETWEQCEFELPADAKYFAFVYSSFGMFGALIDDIVFDPAQPIEIPIDSYDILVSYDGETPHAVKRDHAAPGFVHNSTDGREATYYVVTNVADGDKVFASPLSNPAKVGASSVEGLEAGQFISAGKGKIVIGGAAGKTVTLCDADGRVLSTATVNYDTQTIAVDAGIYLVKLGEKAVKVIVR